MSDPTVLGAWLDGAPDGMTLAIAPDRTSVCPEWECPVAGVWEFKVYAILSDHTTWQRTVVLSVRQEVWVNEHREAVWSASKGDMRKPAQYSRNWQQAPRKIGKAGGGMYG